MDRKRFKKMLSGDIECIVEGLSNGSVIDRFNEIIAVVRYRVVTDEVEAFLKSLCDDHSRAYRGNPDITVSNFAIAALDLLELKTYDGDNEYIQKLIKNNLGIDSGDGG